MTKTQILLTCWGMVAALALAAPPPGVKWIAHRGGVVDSRYAENSPASLNAAVAAGYWMIESDIRETKDGRPIVQHDTTFLRFYNDSRRVSSLTLDEARALIAQPGGTPPMTFRDLAEACRGRLRLMLDIKPKDAPPGSTPPDHAPAFYQEIEEELRRNGLLQSAYLIGAEDARRYFRGKARGAVTSDQLKQAVARGEDVARLYFYLSGARRSLARRLSLLLLMACQWSQASTHFTTVMIYGVDLKLFHTPTQQPPDILHTLGYGFLCLEKRVRRAMESQNRPLNNEPLSGPLRLTRSGVRNGTGLRFRS